MKNRFKLAPLAAAAVVAAAPMAALAFDTIELGDGVALDARLNLNYTIGQRIKKQDPVLLGIAGKNDGDGNFKKNALTTNRLAALLEAKLSKGDTGLVFSASSFYDDVYRKTNDNDPAANNPGKVNKPPPYNEFTDEARRYHGGYSRILDGYGYTSFDLGDSSRATLRLGRQAVNWGEAMYYPNIAQAQGPFDGTKTSIPGTETKDAVLTEDQLSAAIQVNPNWSLLGQVQFGFHETITSAPGAYLSNSDAVGPGAVCLGPWTSIPAIPGLFSGFTGCSFGLRGDDIRPKNVGQWGIGTRVRVTEATELGLYYLHFNDRTPLTVINSFTPGTAIPAPLQPAFGGIKQIGNGSYRIRYFDHVNMLAATASTSLGMASVAAEYSYRKGAPVLVNTVVDPTSGATIPNPTRADISIASVNAMVNLGRTAIAPMTTLIAELAGSYVHKAEAIKAPGVETLPAAFAGAFPASNDLYFQTRSALAYTVQGVLSYPGVVENVDLTIPISFAHQLKGRAMVGPTTGGEGDKRVSIGATVVYGGNASLNLTYLGFLGGSNLVPKTERLLTDRDQISLNFKYSF